MNVRETGWFLTFSIISFIVTNGVCAEPPVITSLDGKGAITWTNSPNTNARYRIEWAATTSGLWHRSFQSIGCIEAHSNTIFTAAVPMFYRVVMATNSLPTGMILVDTSEFQMGNNYENESSEGWYADETPVHTVQVSAFYIERYEVSKALWDKVFGWAITNGYSFNNAGGGSASNQPVHKVSWYDCLKWCNARSQMEGLEPLYYTNSAKTLVSLYKSGWVDVSSDSVQWDANGYRLPTEAEWEKAARGGLKGHHYPWDSYGGSYSNAIQNSQANYGVSGDPYEGDGTSGFPYTTPVGFYNGTQTPFGSDMANGYGLYDMAGNLWEWCWDWIGPYSAGMQTDPQGPSSGSWRILRGGSWVFAPVALRCSARNADSATGAWDDYGFRCVRTR